MKHLRSVVDQLRGCRVLVIGDVMVDEYMKGEVSRISPEAPVPVLEVRSHELALGGAGNAAANIQALGGATMLVGVVGDDETARQLDDRLRQHGIARHLVTDGERPTSKKTRFVAQGQQIVRVDHERRSPVAGEVEAAMMRTISNAIASAQACVLSDYAKGAITPAIAKHAIEAARAAGVPVVVDPKQRDFSVYAGATVITPNLHELDAASRGIHDIEAAATALLPTVGGAALLVTRSAEGMTLFRTGQPPFHVPAMAKEVFDVTGAGDTVVATIAVALAASLGLEIAVELASVAAAIAVSKRGTSTVSPSELAAALDP
ncbi:MAG TPA: D-glycero-beta-D-manno-heptose-7-phosphate kinase [Kofleriaceae bacterium]|nr:D-glycero-beta-D-manno-heptose-7-phosphate kinase [Kofleriaceae bacterium]